MKMSLQKVLSLVLALVMVLGMIPVTALANEVQQTGISTQTMEGLSIAYPYNTETVQRTGTPVSRFQALTFESARGENVRVLSDYVGDQLEIMDPYGGTIQSYGLCFELIKTTIKKLVAMLEDDGIFVREED